MSYGWGRGESAESETAMCGGVVGLGGAGRGRVARFGGWGGGMGATWRGSGVKFGWVGVGRDARTVARSHPNWRGETENDEKKKRIAHYINTNKRK